MSALDADESRDFEAMIARIRARLGYLTTSKSLSARALHSGIWVVIGFGGQRALQFGSNLILTRLLFPEAFGIMSLATVFVVGLAMFSDIGLKPSIIRDPRSRDANFLNTAWTVQAARGFGLFVAGSVLAYPVSRMYGHAVLFPLLIVMSSTAAINGFQTIRLTTAERDLDFLKPTLIALSGQAITILSLIILAWQWQSVWALAAGNVIGSLGTVIVGHWVLRGHSHHFRFDRDVARSILSFGRWIFLSTIVTFAGGEGLRAVQARLLTLSDFGVLSIAYSISVIATELPTKLTGTIGLPALSEALKDGHERLAFVLTALRKRMIYLTVPTVIIAAMVSEPLVTLLYDRRYHDAGHYAALLVLSNAVAVIFSGYSTAILAMGRGRDFLIANTFLAASRLACVFLGYQISGITGMLVGILCANLTNVIYFWIIPLTKSITSFLVDILSLLVILIFTALFLAN